MGFQHNSRKNPTPKNNESVEVARTSLQYLAPVIQKQYMNALAVNGFESIFYSRMTSGRRCTCTYAHPSVDDPSLAQQGNKFFTESGAATPEGLQTMLQDSDFQILDYRSRRQATDLKKPTKVISVNHEGKVSRGEFKHSGNLDDDEATYVDTNEDTSPFDNLDGGLETELNLGDEVIGPDGSITTGNSCGICYGTGYVGGFSMFRGVKITLDATTPVFNAKGFLVRSDLFPNAFESHDSAEAWVEFTTILPRSTVSVESIKLVDKNKALWSGFALEISNTLDPTWRRVAQSNLAYYCNGKPSKIRVHTIDTQAPFKFTHVEIQLLLSSDPTYIDFPHLSKTSDQSVLESIDSVSLNFTPEIPLVQAYDVVYDRVFNKLWRITSAEETIDRIQNVHGHGANARLIQAHEVLNLLMPRPDAPSARRGVKLHSANAGPSQT
jgi:hypothetical protein